VALVPIETYSRERKAEFLLSNAVDAADYAQAVNDVRDLGLDPDLIPHAKPADNGSDAD
jgi:hypothetical protein